jgi:prolyl 4-hydroxylase
VNAVVYKEAGDEYRPHCDGECYGAPYKLGKRVATSINYCEVADSGGQTSFTQSAIKVVPSAHDLLLFAYKLPSSSGVGNRTRAAPASSAAEALAMDNGFTEHSGCPLRSGRKWIATQWYREGVSVLRPWEDMESWRP